MTTDLPPTELSIDQLLEMRRSVRGFIDKPVPEADIKRIFELAQQAPSNCNTQPWRVYVASGETRNQISRQLLEQAAGGRVPEADFNYNPTFQGRYRKRQVECAQLLYDSMGIARNDKPARQAAMGRNFEFFNAPHVAFIGMDKIFSAPNAVDVGIYVQTLMLVMSSRGVASCAQGALALYPEVVRNAFDIPDSVGILLGISFGYEDIGVSANRTKTDRAGVDSVVTFRE